MTDEYPPFRLDMGGSDPGSAHLVASDPTPPEPGPDTSGATVGEGPPPAHWSAGRTIAVVVGSVLLLVSGGFITGGVAALVADQAMRDEAGFVTSDTETFSAETYAVTTENLELHLDEGADWVPEALLGDARITATAPAGSEVFLGMAPSAQVADYLADVPHSVFVEEEDGNPVYSTTSGAAEPAPPTEADLWTVQAAGPGEQAITWEPDAGDWTIVLMNADGTPEVTADVTVGAELPALTVAAAVLLAIGGALLLLSVVMLVLALRRRSLDEGPVVARSAE